MTLPASGALTFSAIITELGRAGGATTSLGETATRTLAGVASGAISASALYGKSSGPPAPVFAPVPGSYSSEGLGSVSLTITCDQTATWTWSRTGVGSASVASGGSASSITFTLSSSSTDKISVFSVNGTVNGVARSWTITLTAYGTA